VALEDHAERALHAALAMRHRFREAERLAGVFREVNEPLTPHHRVHGVAVPCEVAELGGGWERILELEPDVVERVEANLETPCVRTPARFCCAPWPTSTWATRVRGGSSRSAPGSSEWRATALSSTPR
jgi:hypothetical protein